ncbi:MBL fold metallo-hydrolase [Bradymonadaceae bacterium TMQ3]|nr:MBL fold metallo-hydrolase [Bradymonadaceae bacterium TMQ3]TXC73054.1 MBL fold metallo-hydrolase [Bradymonadales bacterium TMQ1]
MVQDSSITPKGLRFISLMGAGGREPNLHLVGRGEGRGLLLDCGRVGGAAGEAARLLDSAGEEPGAVWVSHVHADHMGALSEVVARWPRVDVWMTRQSRELLPFALMSQGMARERAEAIALKVKIAPWRVAVEVMPGVRLTALGAGHMPGAAMALVAFEGRGEDGVSGEEDVARVLYTGDFCAHDQMWVGGAELPRMGAGALDLLVMEATLATEAKLDRVEYEEEVLRIKALLSERGGAVLAGASALGEGGELALMLAEVCRGRTPGLMVDAYMRPVLEAMRRAGEGDGPLAAGASERAALLDGLRYGSRRELRAHLEAGGVALAVGDQFQKNTTAGALLARLRDDPTATLLVTNRAHPSSPAGKLLARARQKSAESSASSGASTKGGTLEKGGARVVHALLPTHALRWQLLAVAGQLNPAQIALVHARDGARFSLKRALQKAGFEGEIHVAKSGECLPL